MSYMNRSFTNAASQSQANTEAFIDEVIAGIVQDVTEAVKVQNESAFTVNNGLKFKLERNGTSNDYLKITVSDSNSHSWVHLQQVSIYSSSRYKLSVRIAANAKVFNMKLRNSYTSASSVYFSADHLFLIDDAGHFYYNNTKQNASAGYAANSSNFAADALLYRCSTNMQGVSVIKRLPYQYSSGSTVTLETTQGKILSEDDIRCGKVGSLVDCSTIAGDQIYPIGSKTYYAIDDNTLIEV